MYECRIKTAIAAVMATASSESQCTSEVLFGEHVSIVKELGEWAVIRQHHDGYTGFLPMTHLQPVESINGLLAEPTHWVCNRSTLLFQAPDFKSPIRQRIPFAAQLVLTAVTGTPFCQTDCGHYVWADHCLPMHTPSNQGPLQIARSHCLGAPYRWGGRSPEGLDCSGLVQLLARSQGLSIPRDSGDQEQAIANEVVFGEHEAGDLVYWPGHTGILVTHQEILHATAFTLSCIIEPLDKVIERAGPVFSIKRLFSES